MTIQPKVGRHLKYPLDLLPGGWLVTEGPEAERRELVERLRECAFGLTEPNPWYARQETSCCGATLPC